MPVAVRVSVLSQIALLVYLQVIEWVDLFPWNDVRNGNGQEVLDIVLGVIMIAAIIATYQKSFAGTALAFVVYAAWLYLQVTTFWIPHIAGASEQWQRVHAAHFAQTIQWLPTWDNHLPPDASHFVLQLILLTAFIATGLAAVKLRPDKP